MPFGNTIPKIHQDHQKFPPAMGVGYLNRFQEFLPPYTNTGTVKEIHEASHPGQVISVQGTAIWTAHSSHEVYCDCRGGEADGHTQGYKDAIPRRLVGESQIPTNLSPAYTKASKMYQELV